MYATVAFGQSADATYNMGPLGFWAAGEMTCGFFITCVPTIPKILKETGVIHRVKRRLGMKVTTKSNSKLGYYGTGNSVPSRGGLSSHVDAYHKLDEDTIGLNSISKSAASESVENLHQQQQKHHQQKQQQHPGITRTTQIIVTADARSDRGSARGGDVASDYKTGWAR